MKKYIKPEVEMTAIEIQSLLNIASAEGAEDLGTSNDEYEGTVDSRSYDAWDD